MPSIPTHESDGHFNFLLSPAAQTWYSPREVGTIVGRTDQFIRDAFDNQRIMGHCLSGRVNKGMEVRRTYQLHREDVILFLLETANFSPSDFIQALTYILRNRSRAQIVRIHKEIHAILGLASPVAL